MNSFAMRINGYSTLFRGGLSLFAAFSASAGYVYFHHGVSWNALFVFLGTASLSASASAFNQLQERHADGLMERTRDRPLPSGRITPCLAVIAAGFLGLLGLITLYRGARPSAALFGLAALFWYNGVYTPIKRKTVFAPIIGAAAGACALLIGWAAAGVRFDKKALCIVFYVFLWQVAHFLLLLLKFGKEYEYAGFPSPAASIDAAGLRGIVYIWLIATSSITLFFPLLGVISNPALLFALICGNGALWVYFYFSMVRQKLNTRYIALFRCMYLLHAGVLASLIVQGLWV
ncbi:MAG: UbiA family prenyltransferase [Chitinispirillaceae bacterium]|jgi:protoheme IX farnesyltransferase